MAGDVASEGLLQRYLCTVWPSRAGCTCVSFPLTGSLGSVITECLNFCSLFFLLESCPGNGLAFPKKLVLYVYRLLILFNFLLPVIDVRLSKQAAGNSPGSEPEPLLKSLSRRTHNRTLFLFHMFLYPQNFLLKTNSKMLYLHAYGLSHVEWKPVHFHQAILAGQG